MMIDAVVDGGIDDIVFVCDPSLLPLYTLLIVNATMIEITL
jgi:hypothetical protein